MAYAALVSLSQTIEKIILNHDQYSISLAQKRRILSLDKYVILLQAFLEDFPEKADSLEGRIRDVASEAEDIIQKFMRKKTQSRFKLIKWRVVLAKFKLKHQLKKLRGEIESITKEAMDMTDNSAPIKDDVGTSQKVMDMESNSSTTEDEETQKEMDMDMESNSSTTEDEEMDMDMDMDMESNSATTEDEETQKEMDMKNNSAIIKDEVEMQKEMDMKNSSVTIKEDVDQLGDFPAGSSSSGLATAGKIDDTVGLDNALIAIQSRLCGQPPELQVIPIVGMGGIGKTTLARKVYNDSLKMHHFDVCVWVTVSQNYSTQEILSGLLISMKLPEQSSIESMAEKVFKNLKRRRYLVVMDDMWSTDAWDDVRNIFPDDSNGSRIILTTRLLDVATYPDSCSPLYEMHSLDQEKSWNLLRQKVFADQKCPKELESIGREIARNCRGLPLAIVVIAGVLSTVTKNPTSWGEIAKNVNSAVTAEHGQVEEILSLSYNHLPHHLRQCFLYLGGFPEDYEIRISKLIKLWVAEGFCQHSNGSQNLEEEAEECLEDLFRRNLVLVSERKSNGKIKSCNLHDLMRDLCIKKAHENKFFLNLVCRNVEKEYCIETLENENRVSVDSSSLTYLSSTYNSTIQTILCFVSWNDVALDFLNNFRLLRVLDVGYAHVLSLPAELFELFHLRYFATNYIGGYLAGISKLQNLQTLIILEPIGTLLGYGRILGCLSQEIWRMPQLRHLLFHSTVGLPCPKLTTSPLENLHTLSSLPHCMCTETILKMIPNLKKLRITFCTRDGRWLTNCSHVHQLPKLELSSHGSNTYLIDLVHLHQLENLELSARCCDDEDEVWQRNNFTFPVMLKKLTLIDLQLPWSEMTVFGSLPNLRVLKIIIQACEDRTWETNEEEFTQLEFLLIKSTSKLKHWITESSHFPRLKCLVLDCCPKLTEIPGSIGEIPTLELIEVKGKAKKSLVESAKRIQVEQQEWGNDSLQVRRMYR